MITSIIAFVLMRQIFLAVAIPLYHHISIIGIGYSFTWAMAALMTGIYYFTSNWLQKAMRE